MQLLAKRIDVHGVGSVTLLPKETEDMWHVYNLVAEGDLLEASTYRKVQKESAGGVIESEKKKIRLTICVTEVDYEPGEASIRVTGTNAVENKFVKMGAFHTLDLALQRKFTLTKPEWDAIALDRIEEACDPSRSADVGAILMQEGLANICLVTPSMTIGVAKIDVTIPRKRKGASGHDKAIVKFYDNVLQAMLRCINFEVVKCVLIASPGFLNEEFYKYMLAEAVKRDIKTIQSNKSKFVLCHSNSGYKQCLSEILMNPQVGQKLADTKAAGEVALLSKFFETLRDDPDRAFYGYRHVNYANEQDAIESLLITDGLFRSSKLEERKKYVNLVQSIREKGGDVRIFSMQHVSGEQLQQLTGVAAILRYPLPGVDEMEDSEGEEDEEDESLE